MECVQYYGNKEEVAPTTDEVNSRDHSNVSLKPSMYFNTSHHVQPLLLIEFFLLFVTSAFGRIETYHQDGFLLKGAQ